MNKRHLEVIGRSPKVSHKRLTELPLHSPEVLRVQDEICFVNLERKSVFENIDQTGFRDITHLFESEKFEKIFFWWCIISKYKWHFRAGSTTFMAAAGKAGYQTLRKKQKNFKPKDTFIIKVLCLSINDFLLAKPASNMAKQHSLHHNPANSHSVHALSNNLID